MTTEFVSLLYVPLLPLRSHRVRELGPEIRWTRGFFANQNFTAQDFEIRPAPLNWRQVLNVSVYDDIVAALSPLDRDGPAARAVAQAVIDIARTGEDDPARIRAQALDRLAASHPRLVSRRSDAPQRTDVERKS